MLSNKFFNYILTLVLCSVLFGCGEQEKVNFTIQGSLINGRMAKTAYLYEFLPQYETIRMIDSARVENNRFVLQGRSDERKPAFIKLDNTKEGINFFLSNHDLNIIIGKNSYSVSGTEDNYRLSKMIHLQHTAINTRKQIQSEYSKLVADSVLTKQLEDSLSIAYVKPSKELRKLILSEITVNMDSDVMFSKMCLRLFSPYITAEEVDSLSKLLNVPVVQTEESSWK